MSFKKPMDIISAEFAPIHNLAERYKDERSCIDPASSAVLISPRPRIGVAAYAIVLYPGIDSDQIARYEQIHHKVGKFDFVIPDTYRTMLKSLNGANLFEMALFGVPGSMTNDPPLLNRSIRQPFDLAGANQNWAAAFKPQRGQFHFGAGPYSCEENLGYFLSDDGSVDARRKGGEVFRIWTSLAKFLDSEVVRAEALFPEYESRWEAELKAIPPKKRNR
jgi:hypothetical protein